MRKVSDIICGENQDMFNFLNFIVYYDQQKNNYLAKYHTTTCLDTIVHLLVIVQNNKGCTGHILK